jgi:hypothetical protein
MGHVRDEQPTKPENHYPNNAAKNDLGKAAREAMIVINGFRLEIA